MDRRFWHCPKGRSGASSVVFEVSSWIISHLRNAARTCGGYAEKIRNRNWRSGNSSSQWATAIASILLHCREGPIWHFWESEKQSSCMDAFGTGTLHASLRECRKRILCSGLTSCARTQFGMHSDFLNSGSWGGRPWSSGNARYGSSEDAKNVYRSSWNSEEFLHDPRHTSAASANPGTRRRRVDRRDRRPGHAALGSRRGRGALSHAARDDPGSCHSATPPIPALLRLRGRSVSRIARCPAA